MSVIDKGNDDVCLLLTVSEDDFKSMGRDVDFKVFRALQVLNKMHNEQVSDKTSKDDKNMWFLNPGKCTVMRHMTREMKVTATPSAASVTAPSVPCQDTTAPEKRFFGLAGAAKPRCV